MKMLCRRDIMDFTGRILTEGKFYDVIDSEYGFVEFVDDFGEIRFAHSIIDSVLSMYRYFYDIDELRNIKLNDLNI